MRPLKLHTKTTVLASAITVAVLATALALVNPWVATIVNEEQRARAELQAINLAEQISHMETPRDPQRMASAANLVRGSRMSIVSVRIWERVGGKYQETAAAAGSQPAEDLPDETIAGLRSGLASKVISPRPSGVNASLYRVFTPITEAGRISGAVELVERLDDAPLIAVRFERTAVSMALAAVILITLATYLLFRQLVYRPIERLLRAMSRAEAGDLLASAPPRAPDELGLLSRGFNRMIERIRHMTEEREAQRRVLQERVSEATSELEQRNEQLEEANRELWQTTRRLTELERLAAAGQTAAQLAHEVGTPLNLISGHVQLLRAQLGGDARAASRLDTITGQIERIERTVRGMLDRTRSIAPALAPLDLNALLLRIFDATAPALDERGVHLETTLAPALPHISGDADRLQQVFINLITNSLDAMPDGGRLHVRTGIEADKNSSDSNSRNNLAEAEPRNVFVEFGDTGFGMTDELRARIFEPFYTTKEIGHGTGLGLVVVRQVVREHGGEIRVESQAGRGTRFHLTLPAIEENVEGKQQQMQEQKQEQRQEVEIK
jgi:signal transduction histidine kinase